VKLLAVEASQFSGGVFASRYQQIVGYGADVFVLNGEGTPDFWPAERYRIAGSKKLSDLIAATSDWHAQEHFDGVFTLSESAVTATAALADELGLPGIGVEAAVTSRNKLLMKQAYERAGVPCAQFRHVLSLDDARAAAAAFGYPAILKPVLGASSNYVFRVDDEAELAERYVQAARGIGQMPWLLMEADGLDIGPGGLMVESFLDGRECLIEALAWDGEVHLGSIVDRVTVEGDTFDDDVHHAPTSLTPDQIAEVHRVVTAAAHAQGLRRSTMHAEIRFHQGHPCVLEIGARPGGGGLDYMSRISGGYCPIRAVMSVACGQRPESEPYHSTGTHTAAMCLICPAGTIEEVIVPAEVADSPQLFFLKITARQGAVILRPPDGNSILGFLGAKGGSFDEAMDTATGLANRIQVRMRP
jgi:biotin carboxylase